MSAIQAKFWAKSLVLSSVVAGAMMMSGCGKKEAETVTLNIGFQKYGLLPIIKERGTLETALKDQGVNVKWVEFPAGPQLLEGLNVGSVVLGEAGEAPPIFAQAANSNLVYIANQPEAPKAEALEIACVAVDPTYRKSNRGSQILYYLEDKAKSLGIQQLFVLTTRTAHWFVEHGFEPASVDDLPNARQALYNYQRNSLVFKKPL